MGRTSTINVPPEVLQEFRKAVFAKHGMLYGRLLEECTAALREHAKRLRGGA